MRPSGCFQPAPRSKRVYVGTTAVRRWVPLFRASRSVAATNLDALNNGTQRLTAVVPTYTRFDLGAGWKHPDGRISFSGYVNNVGNIAYATSIVSSPGLNLRFY